jgi:hypothetical protein
VSRDVWDVLIHHQWSLGRDLEPPVINFFYIFFQNVGKWSKWHFNFIGSSNRRIWGLFVPFAIFLYFFYLGGIIGFPFRHNRLSWRHNRLSWKLWNVLGHIFSKAVSSSDMVDTPMGYFLFPNKPIMPKRTAYYAQKKDSLLCFQNKENAKIWKRA